MQATTNYRFNNIKDMKRINFRILLVLMVALVFSSCKKDNSGISKDVISSPEYIYNKATKKLSPDGDLTVTIASPDGIKNIYSYLIRGNKTDSLVNVFYGAVQEEANNFKYVISTGAYSASDLSQIRGIKVLIRNNADAVTETFVKIDYFDPSKPNFKDFPLSIDANLSGLATPIRGKVLSEQGIKQVDVYDDYQKEGTYVLSKSFTGIDGVKEYALNYDYTYRKASQHIKVVATDIYNQQSELIINMPVDMSVFKPKMLNFPDKVTSETAFTGKITSVTGLKKIEIYDDKTGSYELIDTKANLSSSTDYSFSYTYTLRMRASNIKIIAEDLEGVQAELIIPIDVTYGSVLYRNVEMNAQNAGTKTALLRNGTTIGNCALTANEANIIMLFGNQSAGLTLFNPASAGSYPASLKCDNGGWSIANPAGIHKMVFRVLVKGTNDGVNTIFSTLESNSIDDLSDSFFSTAGTPGSNTPRFTTGAANTSTNLFNLTDGKLLYAKLTNQQTSITKNVLIHIKDANVDGNTNSTIKFDMYIQK